MTVEQQMLTALNTVQGILSKSLPKNCPNITFSSGEFNPGRDFSLYVGVEGIVIGEDANGGVVNRHFIAGYHPFLMKKITEEGTTATSLGSSYI